MKRHKGRILIVEDEDIIRQLLMDILHPLGYRVLMAANGYEALALYKPIAEKIDVLLTDVMMPEMDGHMAARQLRLNYQDWVPLIFLSACVGADDIAAGIEAGGDDYLTKPVDPVVLEAKMIAMQRIAAMR